MVIFHSAFLIYLKVEVPGEKRISEDQTEQKVRCEDIPPDFGAFIISLGSSVLCNLGLIPHPVTKKIEKNLEVARQTIDIICMLQQKTKGNLSLEEANLIQSLLYDLRMKFVEVVSGAGMNSEEKKA